MGLDNRLLVTGAGGQLGRALARLRPDAVLLDRQSLDVTDRRAVRNAIDRHRPQVIVHAAAYTSVDRAEADPEGAKRLNVDGTGTVADAAGEVGALLVYPSTDYVFAGTGSRPLVEGDPTEPLSVYGQTKLEGERIASAVEAHLVVRTSWVFGEGRNFIRAILGAAGTREEVAVVDDQWGRPTYAPDLAGGILALVQRNAGGLIHLGGGGDPATWADFAEAAIDSAGSAVKVRRVTSSEYYASATGPSAPRPRYSVLDCSKAASTGVALRPWRDALAEYVKEIA